MTTEPVAVVAAFGRRLADLGWISALHVGGSLATGDHQPGVSDLDLVAVTDGPVTHERQATLRSIHEAIAPEAKLGCTYVPEQLVGVPDHTHTTWTHGELFERWLSGIARAELLRHGYSVFGPEPTDVWPSMTADEVRQTVVDELTGYWSWAVRRPWLWSSTDQVDLSVTTMLRARHTLVTGELITKSAALTGDDAARCVPAPLVRRGRARRAGADAHPGARLPLEALAAWRLTRRTIAVARGRTPYFPRMILRTRSQRSLIEDSAPNEVGR